MDSFYSDFSYSKPEIPKENKYDQRDRNFDYYYIMQIALKTEALQTSRGITVGSGLQDVTALYGDGIQIENGSYMDVMDVIYEYDGKKIIFRVGDEQKVVQIVLSAFQNI